LDDGLHVLLDLEPRHRSRHSGGFCLCGRYVLTIMFSPVLYGIMGRTIGEISALFSIITQTDSILYELSSATEHMRIARYLIGELADLLNDDLDTLKLKTENSHHQNSALRRAIKDLNVEQLGIAFYRLRYVDTDLVIDGTVLLHPRVTLEGQLPVGRLHGLGSPWGHDAAAQQLELEHGLILDLISGARTPLDGCVIVAPSLTVGVVPRVPLFIRSFSLLENLRYGCRNAAVKPPEDVIWHVCHALGLPRHLFNSHGGSMPMGLIELSPSERQLMSIARSLLAQPDVLLVHNLGQLEPRVARRLGTVFSMYVEGCALGRLTGGMRLTDIDLAQLARLVRRRKSAPVAQGCTSSSLAITRTPDSSLTLLDEESSSFSSNLPLEGSGQRLTAHRRTRAAKQCFTRLDSRPGGSLDPSNAADADDRPDRRTIIWHATVDVLHEAGVDRTFLYKNGRLTRRMHKTEEDSPERIERKVSPPLSPVSSALLISLLQFPAILPSYMDRPSPTHPCGDGFSRRGNPTPSQSSPRNALSLLRLAAGIQANGGAARAAATQVPSRPLAVAAITCARGQTRRGGAKPTGTGAYTLGADEAGVWRLRPADACNVGARRARPDLTATQRGRRRQLAGGDGRCGAGGSRAGDCGASSDGQCRG